MIIGGLALIIIGVSALFHDSACCIVKDGKVIAAAQEERFSRIKNDASMPVRAFRYCLDAAGIDIFDVDLVVYYEKPELKIERQIATGYDKDSDEYAEKMDSDRVKRLIQKCFGYYGEIAYYEHHLSHAASSYYLSGFQEAAILVNDGVGEWATTSYGYAKDGNIEIKKQINYPDSIGLFYSTITNYLGFRVNSGEYKVMGLAPYGEEKYVSELEQLITFGEEGNYKLTKEYYDYQQGTKMYTHKLEELLGKPARKPEIEITQFHKDLAKSLQVVLHHLVQKQIIYLYEITHCENLCLAGGVALNCVANRYIRENGPFKNIFIQPASGDAGGAIGAALLAEKERKIEPLQTVYWGKAYSNNYIEKVLSHTNFQYEYYEQDEALYQRTSDLLAEGQVVGWFQGRMEFGPRALGNRSILADPRKENMRDQINAMVKKREGFRPFAPVVLEEYSKEHFAMESTSPFMLNTYDVTSKLHLPAITHVDNSARVQSVNESQNERLYRLISAFNKKTGCPILLNTSFNVRGEPIVESPENAIDCFISTEINYLVLGNYVIGRAENAELMQEYRSVHDKLKRKMLQANFNLYTFI